MNEKTLFNKYVDRMESIDDPYFRNINADLFHGQNSYLRMRMKGSSFFNDEWIKKIEDCIYELGQIVNNPLEVTTVEGALTPIELAKKINYESIQHLASHSQFIKEIDENGNVVPAKILSQYHKEELHTYENRFIATFIRRLVLFVEKRYEFIRTTVNFDTKDILYVKNKSIVDGQEVEIETKVTVKKENEDSQSKIGKEYVERVAKMRQYVNYFYNSPFMKEMKTEKDVRKPILQTNIIRKNPYYHKCYETFLFIEKFGSLGVEYALDQHFQNFSEKERKSLNYILASHLLSLEETKTAKTYKKSNKVYKPKLLSSIDDEVFTYGDLLRGPIEFVRVDEGYTEYLNKQISKDIPKKPNKAEKEYFKDEIELKKNTEKHHREVEALLKRVRREIAKWEKIFLLFVQERMEKEAEEAKARLELLHKEEEDILNKKRAQIIAAALEELKEEKAEMKREKKAKSKKVEKKAEPVKEETPVVEEKPVEIKEEVQPVLEATSAPEVKKEPKKKPAKKAVSKKQPKKVLKKEKEPAKPEQVVEPVQEVKEPEIAGENKEEVKVIEPKKEAPKKTSKKKPVAPKKEVKAEETPAEEKKPAKAKKEPVKKVAKKKPTPKKVSKPAKEAEPKRKVEKEDDSLPKIPGKFIVKCARGYFVNEKTFSKIKGKAFIFDDFNEARRYKVLTGGKVIKL